MISINDITLIIPDLGEDKDQERSHWKAISESTKLESGNFLYYGSKEVTSAISNQAQYISTTSSSDPNFIRELISKIKTPFAIFIKDPVKVTFTKEGISKLISPLQNDSAILTYSDYINSTNQNETISLIEYQKGSVRDDFDFGPVISFNVEKTREAVAKYDLLKSKVHSGFYALRLSICLDKLPLYINEPLYSIEVSSTKSSYESHFAYVDPKNATVQKEMEEVFTEYAKHAMFYTPMVKSSSTSTQHSFPLEASIIIPVRNRENTIADAINSALNQEVNFLYNVIVIDNHSTDKTTEIVSSIAKTNSNVVHIIPEEKDLLIGGCWNKGISHKWCGKYSVQLDSDDLYIDPHTLQKIVETFRKEHAGAVVGSYKLVDFNLKEIPPGLIDHKEWTPENGHNNALRINGLGAPRAIFTPIARAIKFENVSYGEDYAMMLAICRTYTIARIYEPLYLCRRWEGNSDSNLSMDNTNRNNRYKDLIRTREIEARTKSQN